MSSPLQDNDQLNIQIDEDIWKQYRLPILGGLGALVIVVLGVFFIYQQSSKTEAEATDLYLKTPTVETWKLVIEKYPRSTKAADSLLNLATDALEKKNYSEALSYYQQFAKKFGNHPAREGADLATASCLEALGKKDEAISAYQKLVKNSSYTYLGSATLGLARTYENSGKIGEAKAILTDYVTKHPIGASAKEAHLALSRLNSLSVPQTK